EPAGACASPVLEPDQRQQMAGPSAPLLELDSGEREGQRDVVLDRHGRDEVEGLEDSAHALQAVVGDVAVGQLAQGQPGAVNASGRRAVEPTHQGEERALAAARWAHDRDVLARTYVEGDVAQRCDVHLVPAAKLARDGVQPQPNGLPKEIPELVLPIYGEVAQRAGGARRSWQGGRLVLPIYGEVAAPHLWGATEGLRLRGGAGGARRGWQGGGLVHLYNRDCGVFSRGRAVRL